MITRTLVIDPDPIRRRQLLRLFRIDSTFEIVAQAASLEAAIEAAMAEKPHLATLSVKPGGQAAQMVKALLAASSLPVVLVGGGSRTLPAVFEALAAGALEHVELPAPDDDVGVSAFLRMMKMMSQVKVRRPIGVIAFRLVTIASSTGGPSALRQLLAALPSDLPAPLVIAQHISRGHEEGLVSWLSQDCPFAIKVSEPVETLVPGQVYLGPAERDIVIDGPSKVCTRPASPSGYHPSADALFSSAARVFRDSAVAVVLSGAGSDGMKGAGKLRSVGATVLAQDELTSTVYGMPRAVVEAGFAVAVGSPPALARAIVEALKWRP